MPSYEAEKNLAAAIPDQHAPPLSANAISRRAARPRMQMRDAEAMLDWMVEQGEVESVIGPAPGLMKLYRLARRDLLVNGSIRAKRRAGTSPDSTGGNGLCRPTSRVSRQQENVMSEQTPDGAKGRLDALVGQLRNFAKLGRLEHELKMCQLPEQDRMAFIGPHICEAAADEIERLRAALAKIERMPWPESQSPYVGLTAHQRQILDLMRQSSAHELYQTCDYVTCCLTNSAGIKYAPLPTVQADDLERRGLIARKWPDAPPDVKYWVLPNEKVKPHG